MIFQKLYGSKGGVTIAFLLLTSVVFSNPVQAQSTFTLSEPIFDELVRSWSDFTLIVDDRDHNTTALGAELDQFNQIAPDLVDLEVIGQSYLGQDIVSLRITNELRTTQKAKTLVVSHHHGREQITVEISLRFIIYLLNNYDVDDSITEFIDTQEIYVIPTINPDALDEVVNENNHWLRKNVRPYDDDNDGLMDEDRIEDVDGDGIISGFYIYDKVGDQLQYNSQYFEGIDNDGDGLINEDMLGHTDLNRNYDAFWRDGTSWSDDSQDYNYPGDAPFSEPETQAFRDFALNHRFTMAYSLHAGYNATLLLGSLEEGFVEPELYSIINQEFVNMLPPSYDYYNPSTSNIVSSNGLTFGAGAWAPWMYFERKTLVPMTFEIYLNATAVAPASEIAIVDNSTHLITEWKEIASKYEPRFDLVDQLWSNLLPVFYYLLESTPRLSIQPTLRTSTSNPDSEFILSFECKNLSPRIHTVVDAYVFDVYGTILDTLPVILPLSTEKSTVTVKMDTNVNRIALLLGNEFIGFSTYFVDREPLTYEDSDPTLSPLPILNYSMVVYGIGLSLLFKNRKNKMTNSNK